MIGLKTGALLSAACRIGAIIGDADPATADALAEYGMELGLAFQLRDDWLDTFGDHATFGSRNGATVVQSTLGISIASTPASSARRTAGRPPPSPSKSGR